MSISRLYNLFITTEYAPSDPLDRQFYGGKCAFLTKKELKGIKRGYELARMRFKTLPIFPIPQAEDIR